MTDTTTPPKTTLHLMTQRDQPYGSVRKCCEICGVMLVAMPDAFWQHNAYTESLEDWKFWPAGSTTLPGELIPCSVSSTPTQPIGSSDD